MKQTWEILVDLITYRLEKHVIIRRKKEKRKKDIRLKKVLKVI